MYDRKKDKIAISRRLHISCDLARERNKTPVFRTIERRHSISVVVAPTIIRERDSLFMRASSDGHSAFRRRSIDHDSNFPLLQHGLSSIHPRPLAAKNKGLTSARPPFSISLCSKDKDISKRRFFAEIVQSNAQIDAKLLVSSCEVRKCGQSIVSAIRNLLQEKEGLDWIPVCAMEEIHSHLRRLQSLVSDIYKQLGCIDVRQARPQEPFRTDQAALMIKAAALALSREASALVSAAANSKAGALTSVDSSAVCEAAVLAALVTCVIASARRLVPGDALRTLGATRRLFGAAILRRMGLAAGV